MAGVDSLIGGLDAIGFFSYAIPYLLTIALVYAILEHVKMPQSKAARSILSILAGFLVLPLGPVLQPYLSRLGLSLIVLASGILVLVIIAESIGLKAADKKHLWEEYPKITSLIMVTLGIVVFIGAGGLELLGFRGSGGVGLGSSVTLIFFLIIIIWGIWWITKE